MLRIRLTRIGKKRQPYYRIVVADVEAKRDGRIVEQIGHYNPLTDPETFSIEEGRALYWLSVGAQPSDAVRRLLDKQGTSARLTRFNAGESMDSLVAEFEGLTLDETPAAAKAAVAAAPAVVAEMVAIAEEEE
jgi:small subunit ribosomal protein S16